MSTSSVVRDMISILDAYSRSEDGSKVENSSLLNYWGFSYGTFLGQTFASMFPDRVGRMVLDGVMDADDWTAGTYLTEMTDVDELFSTFFFYCHLAGSAQCSFNTGTTAQDISSRFESILSKLNSTYAKEQGWQNATQIDDVLKTLRWPLIFGRLYSPIDSFPELAELFSAMDAGLKNPTNTTLDDLGRILNNFQANVDISNTTIIVDGDFTSDFVTQGVQCSDNGGVLSNLTSQDSTTRFNAFMNQSYIGGLFEVYSTMLCVEWPIVTNYRFPGETNF
jgi:hypothetical protein